MDNQLRPYPWAGLAHIAWILYLLKNKHWNCYCLLANNTVGKRVALFQILASKCVLYFLLTTDTKFMVAFKIHSYCNFFDLCRIYGFQLQMGMWISTFLHPTIKRFSSTVLGVLLMRKLNVTAIGPVISGFVHS